MKFSTTFALAFVIALANSAFAAENSTQEEQVGTSKGAEFPFSDDVIIEAVDLGKDIAPIVLDDAVYFINTTIAESDMSRLSKRDAEAFNWWAKRPRFGKYGSKMYKREALRWGILSYQLLPEGTMVPGVRATKTTPAAATTTGCRLKNPAAAAWVSRFGAPASFYTDCPMY